MKKIFYREHRSVLFFLLLTASIHTNAATIEVNSKESFAAGLGQAAANDTIAWEDGTYEDIFMDIRTSNLVVRAKNPHRIVTNRFMKLPVTKPTLAAYSFFADPLAIRELG
jgi:hypothetical protein